LNHAALALSSTFKDGDCSKAEIIMSKVSKMAVPEEPVEFDFPKFSHNEASSPQLEVALYR
jgi:hypothetical protein